MSKFVKALQTATGGKPNIKFAPNKHEFILASELAANKEVAKSATVKEKRKQLNVLLKIMDTMGLGSKLPTKVLTMDVVVGALGLTKSWEASVELTKYHTIWIKWSRKSGLEATLKIPFGDHYIEKKMAARNAKGLAPRLLRALRQVDSKLGYDIYIIGEQVDIAINNKSLQKSNKLGALWRSMRYQHKVLKEFIEKVKEAN